ncbi:hypothetical protein [Stutzerimonas xanthomarina]|uniref:hypothetical protein n=1 Tax=Stutzerimonas xanthomarina TaxID=271420 RepID=UPI000F79DDC0|nr:hypothetical protein [Stutzerimonas xanthomarina]
MERTGIDDRFNDYVQAFKFWLNDQEVKNIIFVENSGYDLQAFREIAVKAKSKKVEFVSFDGQHFDRSLGKGYGEMLALRQVLTESELLKSVGRFIKVNGRYYVPDLYKLTELWHESPEVICDFTKNLTWSDSRVFGGTRSFLENFLLPELMKVNDTTGRYFEHALAFAAHSTIAAGGSWELCPPVPIIGISGTDNAVYKRSKIKENLRLVLYKVKKYLLAR